MSVARNKKNKKRRQAEPSETKAIRGKIRSGQIPRFHLNQVVRRPWRVFDEEKKEYKIAFHGIILYQQSTLAVFHRETPRSAQEFMLDAVEAKLRNKRL